MITLLERYFESGDERGRIEGLVACGEWRELNLITSRAGTVRGDHYHRSTRELFVILDGEIRVVTQAVRDATLVGPPSERVVGPGDVFIVEPEVNHVFHVTRDARWINALSERMAPGAPDILRVPRGAKP